MFVFLSKVVVRQSLKDVFQIEDVRVKIQIKLQLAVLLDQIDLK